MFDAFDDMGPGWRKVEALASRLIRPGGILCQIPSRCHALLLPLPTAVIGHFHPLRAKRTDVSHPQKHTIKSPFHS